MFSHTVSTPDVIVAVPTDPLFVGTSRYLTCTITVMPEVVDSNVTVEVMWVGPAVSSVRSNQSPAAELSPGSGEYQANLTLAPLTLSDVGDYVCTVTVKPAEESIDIIASDSVMVTGNITTINGTGLALSIRTVCSAWLSPLLLLFLVSYFDLFC